ncbi:MAG TPA: non-homologous end-joining DNA ligase [Candidatus Tyrphobacter sp.]
MASQRVDVRIGNRTLSLSNLDKVLWPRDGYTKRDLIAYYEGVSATMIPYLENRPLTLERFPNGIDASSFFEKNVPKGMPEWVHRVTLASPGGTRSKITYVLCNDAPSLIYLANLAAIVLHVWTSRVGSIAQPDFVLFDLDPGEHCTLKTLATVTLAIRDALASVGLSPLVKTSGGLGLHVVVPLAGGHSYEQAKIFAEIVARHVAAQCGGLVTLERMIAKRRPAAVYIDYVQVGHGKTLVAPFSVRARDAAPVSWPLDWSEVEAFKRSRTPVPADAFAKYTIRTVPKALHQQGDRWSGRSWKRAKLETTIGRARKLWR